MYIFTLFLGQEVIIKLMHLFTNHHWTSTMYGHTPVVHIETELLIDAKQSKTQKMKRLSIPAIGMFKF